MTLCKKLQRLRKGKCLSQEQLAEQINVSRQTISKWELEESLPEVNKIIQLSKLFQVSTDYLLNDDFDNDMNITTDKEKNDYLQKSYRIRRLYIVCMGIVTIGLFIAVISWLRWIKFFPDNMYFIIQHNILPVSIGFTVQVVGIIVFEALYSQYIPETANKTVRMNFYIVSTWIVLPFPLIYFANILLSAYRRPITFLTDLVYIAIPYIIVCGIINFCLKRRMKGKLK